MIRSKYQSPGIEEDLNPSHFLTNDTANRVPWSLRLLYPLIQMSLGALIIGFALDLDVFADNCSVSTNQASWSLIIMGVGVLFATPFVYIFSSHYDPHDSIPICLLISSCCTLAIPYVTSIIVLCIITFIIGFVTNIISADTYNLLRKLFLNDAGKWCSISNLSYAFGGVIGTLLNIISYSVSSHNNDNVTDSSSSTTSVPDIQEDIITDITTTNCINCSPWFFISISITMLLLSVSFFFVSNPSIDDGVCIESDDISANTTDSSGAGMGIDEHSSMLPKQSTSVSSNTSSPHRHPHHHQSHEHHPLVSTDEPVVPHYYVEIALCFVMLASTGTEYILLSYLTSFAEETSIETYTEAYYQASIAWCLVFVGMIIGLLDQAHLLPYSMPMPKRRRSHNSNDDEEQETYWNRCISWCSCRLPLPISDETLPNRITTCLAICTVSLLFFALPVTGINNSKIVFWISTSIYSLANGPIVGYTFDWLNRTTLATEFSTAIVMTGVNAGASAIILIMLLGWYVFDIGVWSVIYVAAGMPLLVIPLIWYTLYASYRVEINPVLQESVFGRERRYGSSTDSSRGKISKGKRNNKYNDPYFPISDNTRRLSYRSDDDSVGSKIHSGNNNKKPSRSMSISSDDNMPI